MSFQNNPNIIKITGTLREINGRSMLGRNGADDIWHYADIVIEDAAGKLFKFERVTTNQQVDPEIEIGNECTFYFRRIWSWNSSVFHIIASESANRGISKFVLYHAGNRIAHVTMVVKTVPGMYFLGLVLFAIPARLTIGISNIFWLALLPPVAFLLLNHFFGLAAVRKDAMALHKELEQTKIGVKFQGRELKTV